MPIAARAATTTVALAALSLLAGGCRGASGTISRERFIAANIALRIVPDSARNADSLRAAALRRSGVSAAQLRAFVRVNGRRTKLLADVWNAIDDSVRRRNAPPPRRTSARATEQAATRRGASPALRGERLAPRGEEAVEAVRPSAVAPPPPPPPPPPGQAPEERIERIRKPGAAAKTAVP